MMIAIIEAIKSGQLETDIIIAIIEAIKSGELKTDH